MTADASISSALVRKFIGRRFKKLREDKGLTQVQVALQWDHSRGSLQRWEDGADTVIFRRSDVKDLLDVYDASDEDRELLLGLTAQTRVSAQTKPWYEDKTLKNLPDWFGLYWSLEESAQVIFQHEVELIPGLLQTEQYAAAIMRVAGDVSPEQAAERVGARMKRQSSILGRARPPRMEFVFSEAALLRVAQMGDVGREQLEHLLKVSQQPTIDVRIVPVTAGVHAGMAYHVAFSMLEFPINEAGKPWEQPLVYTEVPTGSMYQNKPEEVAIYQLIRTRLTSEALDPDSTRHLITALLEGLSQ